MSVDFAHFYNTGMSWEEYLDSCTEGADRMRSFYDDFEFDEDVAVFFNSRTPLQVLAIAEDWCPDVIQNLAVMARIGDEVPGMELAIVTRDANPELMNEFLTNGKRRIPVFAFYDMTFRELGHWAGRCKSADAWILNEVLQDTGFEEMDPDVMAKFNESYDMRFRETYARETIKEWENLLTEEDF